MAYAPVRDFTATHTNAGGLTSATNTAPAAGAQAGDDLFIGLRLETSALETVTASDNSTQTGTANSYATAASKLDASATSSVYLIYCHLTRALVSGDVITFSWTNASDSAGVIVAEWGGGLAAPLDVTASASGSSTAMGAGTTGATAQANEVAIAVYTSFNTNGGSFTPATNYTQDATSPLTYQNHAATKTVGLYFISHILAAIGTQTAASTFSLTTSFAGALATFKAAAVVIEPFPLGYGDGYGEPVPTSLRRGAAYRMGAHTARNWERRVSGLHVPAPATRSRYATLPG